MALIVAMEQINFKINTKLEKHTKRNILKWAKLTAFE